MTGKANRERNPYHYKWLSVKKLRQQNLFDMVRTENCNLFSRTFQGANSFFKDPSWNVTLLI